MMYLEWIMAAFAAACLEFLGIKALSGYFIATMTLWHRYLLGAAAILVIAPDVQWGIIGAAMAFPIVLLQYTAWQRGRRKAKAGSAAE